MTHCDCDVCRRRHKDECAREPCRCRKCEKRLRSHRPLCDTVRDCERVTKDIVLPPCLTAAEDTCRRIDIKNDHIVVITFH